MTQNDIAVLKQLSTSREFEVMQRLSEEMIENWTRQIATGSTEFEYLRGSFERDGKIIGLRAFINEISKLV